MPDYEQNAEARWYVVHTYSGYENAVASTITKYVDNRNLQNVIQDIQIPMESVTEITDNGPKTTEHKVFPGYVFVKMVLTDETWHIIRNIRGATGFVGEGNKAIPLSQEEVLALGVEKIEIKDPFAIGDHVRIIDGALSSFIGVVDGLDVAKNRVHVIVQMFGRETPADLELNQVELIEED